MLARAALPGRWAWLAVVNLALAGAAPAAPPDSPQQAPAESGPSPSADGTAAPPPTGAAVVELPALRPLDRPLESPPEAAEPPPAPPPAPLLRTPVDPPLGFAGPSGILPRDGQPSSDFVPIEDRWRIGFPDWDRYDKGHPLLDDYPYDLGNPCNPYQQNLLKGDYPLFGQNTFLNVTGSTQAIFDFRQVPTPANGFESTARPGEEEVFGRPNQFFYTQFFSLSADLFHGDASFKPADWRIHVTPVFDINSLAVEELGIVSPDVTKGTSRGRSWLALQEWFAETKLADLGPDYDFLSVRVGSQPFTSDFRGFLFSDTNRGVRLFGTRLSDRDEFNLVYFHQLEKDTDSELNTFQDRHQDIVIANYYRQDFIWPGYTTEVSVSYNHDAPTFHFDKNGFLTRPDPDGVFQPHDINVAYLGWGGDGHIGWLNITHQFYWALGRDSLNPIANQPVDIDAQMAAVELSIDRDWMRFRTSFLWASGDSNPNSSHATGFDAILDDPNFAGGDFSYWQRQQIKLLGVNLVQEQSLLPDLRSSKTEGQSNFVNPGLVLANLGVDMELTPKLKMINNVNFLWFNHTEVLEQFVYQAQIHHFIGTDLSSGVEYRPLLSNNIIMRFGISSLIPGRGFSDLYSNLAGPPHLMLASFLDLKFTF